jgi:aminoglycoside phosphotransferase (APT) family kinase protein
LTPVESTQQVEGVDVGRVTDWFVEHVDNVVPPLRFDLIAGGHSNLTFRVDDANGSRWVLRRPPLGHVLATAHDMGREHRIISALGPTDVPVAPAIGLCTDEEVNGVPFYVMGFVDGHVVRDAETARTALDAAGRRRAGESIVDVMARIHAVDVDAVGLGELGRKEGYIERQLKRWYGQWEKSKTRELPAVDEVYETLLSRIPEQGPAAIVHGDYRLDNCLVDDSGSIVAVLDWEICTLGDPLADVGLLMVYWTDPDDDHPALLTAPTVVDGFPKRAELLARYAEQSGRDVSNVDFYIAFGYWKLACIVEGVYARYVGGAMGKASSGFEGFADQVTRLAASAADAVGRAS